MNRRTFFKALAGSAAGIFSLFSPNKTSHKPFIKKHSSGGWTKIDKGYSAWVYVPYGDQDVPYDTIVYPSFDSTGNLIGFYWRTEDYGKQGRFAET